MELVEGDQSTHSRTDDEKVESLRSWLAEPWNDRWLDNHDNPKMPGHNSRSAYDLRPLFPSRAHGKILITTRSADLTYTKRLDLKEVESVDVALKLLSQRASRDMTKGMLSDFQIFHCRGHELFEAGSNMPVILDELSITSAKISTINDELPLMSGKITTIHDDMPVLADKVTVIHDELPAIRVALERLAVSSGGRVFDGMQTDSVTVESTSSGETHPCTVWARSICCAIR
jgi:hypothetical protein